MSDKSIIQYYIPEDGDEIDHPNVYTIEKKMSTVTLADVREVISSLGSSQVVVSHSRNLLSPLQTRLQEDMELQRFHFVICSLVRRDKSDRSRSLIRGKYRDQSHPSSGVCSEQTESVHKETRIQGDSEADSDASSGC